MDEEKKKNNKKTIIMALVLLLLAGIVLFIYLKETKTQKTGSNQNLSYDGYISEGLKYKSEGDAGNKNSYYKAIENFKKAAEVSQGKVWVPYLNLGNTYRLVGNYDEADNAYFKALKIAPDSTIYLAELQMYQSDLKRSEPEMKAAYEEALSRTGDNIDIMTHYASYLSDNADYADSLKYWKKISEKYPDQQMYKDEIAALEAKIKK
jgi:tetratricopeptide (TPR) repeat protein